ncbi:MAG: DNA polymerase III subunit delta [candidate division GAL15 bacterium]
MRGRAARVYLVVGEEAWLRRQAVDRIVSAHLSAADRSLNLDRLDAGELDVFELLTRLDTLPFFGPARVVVVQEVHRMPAPAQERLASHLEAGPPASVVVLEAASLDRRRRLWNVVQRVGEVVEADRVDDRRAVAWVASRVRELGKRITGDAARALGAAVGTDLQALASEVEKLVAYAHEDATVELAHVEAVASHGAEVSVFALTDAVARGEAAQALRVLHRLLQRENPVALVALLASHFRALVYAHALSIQHAGAAEVRRVLGNRAWRFGAYREQARRLGSERLAQLYQHIERTDLQLKTSAGAPEVLVQQLVVRLCGQTGGGGGTA